MNYRYSWILLAALAGTTMAQHAIHKTTRGFATPQAAHATPARALNNSQGSMKVGGDVVFSEDFANGFAGNNGVGSWTADGPNASLWVHTTYGPNGAYSGLAATQPTDESIESTTAANGWMIFQSDSGNTNWADTTIVAAPENWDAGLVSPVIDLSATPFVRLEWEQRMRYCCGSAPQVLQVSYDGGANWTSSFSVNSGAANADAGTITTSVNIAAAIAGDPSNVRFRFYHDGPNSQSSHYHWQIDDVRIVELFSYDVQVDGGATSAFDLNTATTYDSLRYSVYPFGQLRPVPLNMTVTNNGSEDQNGLTANFLVMQGANTVLDQDQNVDVPAGLSQKVFVDPAFTPPAVAGNYDVTYSVTSSLGDTTTGNDEATASFAVSEFIYARDLGKVTGYESGDADNGEYELCNTFHAFNDATLYAVNVAMRSGGNPSPVGSPITGELRDPNDPDFAMIAETSEHEIASNELNNNNGQKFIVLRFDPPQDLTAGTDYMVCVHHLGGTEVRTGTNGVSEDQTSFIYYNGQNGLDWYYTTTTPMVRMNFDASAGITENDRQNGVGLGQNFPNPSKNSTTIPYDLKMRANVTFEVHDLSGKLVLSQGEGVKAPGSYLFEINTADLNEGVYFYTMTAGGVRLTKRMTVMH